MSKKKIIIIVILAAIVFLLLTVFPFLYKKNMEEKYGYDVTLLIESASSDNTYKATIVQVSPRPQKIKGSTFYDYGTELMNQSVVIKSKNSYKPLDRVKARYYEGKVKIKE